MSCLRRTFESSASVYTLEMKAKRKSSNHQLVEELRSCWESGAGRCVKGHLGWIGGIQRVCREETITNQTKMQTQAEIGKVQRLTHEGNGGEGNQHRQAMRRLSPFTRTVQNVIVGVCRSI